MISINEKLRKDFQKIAVLSVLFITIVANLFITGYFGIYVNRNIYKQDKKILTYLQDYFSSSQIDSSTIHNIVIIARSEGVEIKVKDLMGKIIIDSTNFMMGKQGKNGHIRKIWLEKLKYKEYPLILNKQKKGKVLIGRPAVFMGNNENRIFLFVMNAIFILTFLAAVLFSSKIASITAAKFLQPLIKLKNNIMLIKKEKYDELEMINSEITEINQLFTSTQDMAKRFNELERLRRQLTADIAHELRTPLATLQAQLENMIDGVWKTEPQRLIQAHDETIRLTKLVSDLSDLSKVENNQIILEKEEFDLSKLVKQVVDDMYPGFEYKKQKLSVDIEDNIYFYADKARIKQIVMNILDNSNKYTLEGGEIKVTLKKDSGKITFTVEDSGIGIPKEDLPYIFERFYRGEKSRNKKTGGTGIGLTITKLLVKAHGGTIAVSSTPGRGSKFTVIFK